MTIAVRWTGQSARASSCPVCADAGAKREVLETTRGEGSQAARTVLLQCPACQVRYAEPLLSVDYGDGGATTLKFYLEQGAGIDVMLEPLSLADGRPVRQYLEIGCSFGFAMDYARQVLGWNVRGFDPGAIAARGREELQLPIEHTTFALAAGDERCADLVYCSEVIEHLAEPHGFLDLIARALRPDGQLLMTTPDADKLSPETAMEMLVPILSPGHHVVLYNSAALTVLLRRHGFAHLRFVPNGGQLRVAASRTPFGAESGYFTRARYAQYLERAVARHGTGSPVGIGFASRLLKEHVHAARFEAARAPLKLLRDAFTTQYGFDIAEPDAVSLADVGQLDFSELGRRFPYNLTGIWYAQGMIALLLERDYRSAAKAFRNAARFGLGLRRALRAIGADDLETAALGREAEVAELMALAHVDADEAMATLTRLEAGESELDPLLVATHRVRARQRLFTVLVGLGNYVAAEKLLEAGLPQDRESPDAEALSTGLAHALFLLNHRADFATARDEFRAVAAAAQTTANGPLYWAARFHQGLASRHLGDAKTAAEIAAELVDPPADMPPIAQEYADRRAELLPAPPPPVPRFPGFAWSRWRARRDSNSQPPDS